MSVASAASRDKPDVAHHSTCKPKGGGIALDRPAKIAKPPVRATSSQLTGLSSPTPQPQDGRRPRRSADAIASPKEANSAAASRSMIVGCQPLMRPAPRMTSTPGTLHARARPRQTAQAGNRQRPLRTDAVRALCGGSRDQKETLPRQNGELSHEWASLYGHQIRLRQKSLVKRATSVHQKRFERPSTSMHITVMDRAMGSSRGRMSDGPGRNSVGVELGLHVVASISPLQPSVREARVVPGCLGAAPPPRDAAGGSPRPSTRRSGRTAPATRAPEPESGTAVGRSRTSIVECRRSRGQGS